MVLLKDETMSESSEEGGKGKGTIMCIFLSDTNEDKVFLEPYS